VNAGITTLVTKANSQVKVIDLCNQLSLAELAAFLPACAAMIGNDSGPFHLGSALGVPGLVLWGPTNKAIWGPLGKQSDIVQGTFPCDPACNKGSCLHDHRCLREISPDDVFARLSGLINRAR
jgi:ADP-heptose:LPS heptosyltransferase